jgi:hypothetical protein
MAHRRSGNGGGQRPPLCREPWKSYYILRRGVLPCCHGIKPIAPMSEWKTAWNSPALQEIRASLARGEFSQYCLESVSCPIVQRHVGARGRHVRFAGVRPSLRPPLLRAINRVFLGLPARLYRSLTKS